MKSNRKSSVVFFIVQDANRVTIAIHHEQSVINLTNFN